MAPTVGSVSGSQPSVEIGDLGPAPIIPILLVIIGGYLMWFGVHYWRRDITWPSDPIKSVLQGNGLPDQGSITTSSDILTSVQGQQSGGTNSGGSSEGSAGPVSTGSGKGVPPPPSGGGSSQNTARMLLGQYGWSPAEMAPLILLWDQESGWSASAWNASGAYGVAQALGHAKQGECAVGPRSVGSSSPGSNCSYGSDYGLSPDQARAANSGNAYYQIRWGLGYIKSRYGSPSGAWGHEQQFDWY